MSRAVWKQPKVALTIPHSPCMGMWGSDASKWTAPKDLSEYRVEKVLASNDPDWLQFGDGIPEYDSMNVGAPKALQDATLKLWRPEALRPAAPKPSCSPRFSASSTSIGTSRPSTGASRPCTIDTWASGSSKSTGPLSRRTIAAVGGSLDWSLKSATMRSKFEPLQFSLRSAASQPLLPVRATSACEDPASTLLFRSMTAFGSRQFADSGATLEKAMSSDPRHSPVWRQRGVAKTMTQDYDGVIADCTEAVRLDGSKASTWARRADAKMKKGDIKGAMRDCSEAISRDNRLHRTWHSLGVMKLQLGDVVGSMKDCEKATRLDPAVAEYWGSLAAGKVRMEEFASAAEDCSEAIRLDGHHVPAWASRAVARNGLAQYEGALADSNQALRFDRNCVVALAQRAYAKVYLKDCDGALADCNRALALNPRLVIAWCTRGEAKFQQGDFNAAIQDFDQAIAVESEHPRAWWYRGKAYMALGQYEAARIDSAHAYNLQPRFDDACNNVAVATAHASTVSTWRIPILQRGLPSQLAREQELQQEQHVRQYEGTPVRPGSRLSETIAGFTRYPRSDANLHRFTAPAAPASPSNPVSVAP